MSENKRKKKKKRRRNNSSKQKKIGVVIRREEEGKPPSVRENIDGSRRSRRSMFADCYQMVYARIANAFVSRDHHGHHVNTTINVDCKSEVTIPQKGFPFTQPNDSLSMEDNFGYQYKKENHSRDNLFEAMLDLCKRRPRTDNLVDKPITNFLNLYHDIDNFTLSLLIELFNNEPGLSMYDPEENIHFGSDILNAMLRGGSFCSLHVQTIRSKPNRSYADQNAKVFANSDRNEPQEILGKTMAPLFFFCPCYACCCLTTSLLADRAMGTTEKDTEIFYGPECRNKALLLPLGVRKDRLEKRIIDCLAGRPYLQDVDVNVAVMQDTWGKGAEIMLLLAGRSDTRGETSSNIEIDILRKLLKFHDASITLPAVATGCTSEIIGPMATFYQDCHLKRNSQALTQKTWYFPDLFRLSFKVGQEAHTIIMNFSSTEEFWRRVQPLQNYMKMHQTATQRLQDSNRDAVVQYRSSEQMIDATVDMPGVPGRERLSISSVPLSLLKMFLHTLSRRLTAVDVQNTIVNIYQVPAFSRYGPASKGLYIHNQNRRTFDENLTFALQQRNTYTFWQHFPRPREIYENPVNNITDENSDTTAARLNDPKVTDIPDREPIAEDAVTKLDATNLDVEETEKYDSFDISELRIKHKHNEWDHPKGTRGRDYQTFDVKVPDSLMYIQVPSIDISDIQFKTDTDGNRMVFVSGVFGDIFQGHLSTGEEVIVKKVKHIKYKDVLRQTRIQTYLMSDGFVPKMLGIIGGPGHSETMITQQMCSKGRTLNDLIEACLAETLVLFTSHWLQLCHKLAVNLERMHNKGILHNDIKADNILVDVRPNDVRIYYIDFGQASFRSGSTLLPPDECDDSEDLDHIAPEVRSGYHSSPKSDIYSLGVIFGDIADEFCDCLGPLADEMCYGKPRKRLTLDEVSEQIEELIMENEYN